MDSFENKQANPKIENLTNIEFDQNELNICNKSLKYTVILI